MNLFLASALAEGTEEAAAAAEEAVEATPTWAQELVEKFSEISGATFVILGALVALAVVLLLACRTSKRWNAKAVAFAALSIALSYVLSCFRLYRMPQGGSVTPGSMLPIMLFSAAYGVGPGVVVGVVYGALQYLQGGWFLNVWQFLLDYLLAYGALGLAGLARKLPKRWGLYAAIVIAAVVRALSATLAGYMFWDTAFWASLVYNGTYLIPDTLICIVLALAVAKPVMKIMQAK